MFNQCRHIRTSGTQCGMAAMRSRNFCYYHQNCQPRPLRSAVRTRPHTQQPTQTYDYGAIPVSQPAPTAQIQPPVQLLFPEDRASIQINLYRIAVAQAENRIDTRTANSMTWNQQVCMANLSRQPLIDAAPTPARSASSSRDDDNSDSASSGTSSFGPRIVHRVILTPDGDEIAPPVEILEPNEAEPIHHKGCPCLLCAEKYRNQPPEEHHPACQCGLCEEAEGTVLSEQGTQRQGTGLSEQSSKYRAEHSAQRSATTHNDVILSEARFAREVEGPGVTEPATRPITNNDVILSGARVACAVEGPAVTKPGTTERASGELGTTILIPDPCSLSPARRKRVARAAALLSGSTNRDPLNRPWSIAEYTFGDAVRRHEAQYAARAAAALAVGIEPPPYEPYITGLIHPGTPEHEEDQQMQQHSSEYWAAHFRKLIAERPDIQQALDDEEQAGETAQ
jgi:hypothetical protein